MEINRKILVAEDDADTGKLMKRVLSAGPYEVTTVSDGQEALDRLKRETFDILLTDWMMPRMEGLQLIRETRDMLKTMPLILMVTAIDLDDARKIVLDAGADGYLNKPFSTSELLEFVSEHCDRFYQEEPKVSAIEKPSPRKVLPSFVGVVISSSTGGPPVVTELFSSLAPTSDAAFFLVQHGPEWMLKLFAQRLKNSSTMPVILAEQGMVPDPGNIYLAPGDRHLIVNPVTSRLELKSTPKENFVRPAADPLLRSVSGLFGAYCLSVMLTGMGRDGTQGTVLLRAGGGSVIVQDPETAVATSMPATVIKSGVKCEVVPIENLPTSINDEVVSLSIRLKKEKAKTPKPGNR